MVKKILFAMMLAMTVFSLAVCAEIIPEKAPLTYDKYDLDGNGVFDDMVYEISTKEQLYWFAEAVNGGNTSINAVLTNDISVNENLMQQKLNIGEPVFTSEEKTDATGNTSTVYSVTFDIATKDGETVEIWTPIGTSPYNFNGIFDGLGHTVSGLYFNNTERGDGQKIGLFGCVKTGKVRNVNVSDTVFFGYSEVGGIVGSLYHEVYNCTFNGFIYTSQNYAGGIAGIAERNVPTDSDYLRISHCVNYGTVVGNTFDVAASGITPSFRDYSKDLGNTYLKYCTNYGRVYSANGSNSGICEYVENLNVMAYCYNAGEIGHSEAKQGGCAIGSSPCGDDAGIVKYCYSTGKVYDSASTGNKGVIISVRGNYFLGSPKSPVQNCYYLKGTATNSSNAVEYCDVPIAKSEEYLKSEEFLKLLSGEGEGTWTVGEDGYPVPAAGTVSTQINPMTTGDTLGHIYSAENGSITFAFADGGAEFILVFADYDESGAFKKLDTVDFSSYTPEKQATKYTINLADYTELALESGDKVFIWADKTSFKPICEEYTIE